MTLKLTLRDIVLDAVVYESTASDPAELDGKIAELQSTGYGLRCYAFKIERVEDVSTENVEGTL